MKNNNHLHKKRIYFIGIGGIGVSALARYFLSKGYEVSGSDASRSELIDELKKSGIKIYIGHKSTNVSKNVNLIIHSAAIKKDNPEIVKAEQLGIPYKRYAEVLGELVNQYKTIAIAGAHGKSTTTAMASLVFTEAGLDPTVIIGTKLKEFGGSNFRNGKSDWLIIEADEYSGAFLNYSPFAAIITNIDLEHLDYYKNLADIKKSFLKFIGNIKRGGILVVNKDDKNLFSLKNKIKKIASKNKLRFYWHSIGESITVNGRSHGNCYKKIRKILKVPGKHNLSNASEVYIMAKALNVADKPILKALGKYRGAWRRMEFRGEFKIQNSKFKILVYDDYAHHPTEIKATLAGARQKWPEARIVCVFQPHQEKRLRALFKEFSGAFNDADDLILLDIYKVKGRDETVSDMNSQKLAQAIQKHKQSPAVIYLKNHKNLKNIIKNIITLNPKPNTLNHIVIMMGAGDIYKLTDGLIRYKI